MNALNATQKTSALCKVPFLKKIKKNHLKMVIFDHSNHVWPFWEVHFYFLEMVLCWGFPRCIQCIETLLLSYLNQHSNILFLQFFILRRDLNDSWVVKVTWSGKNGQQELKKKIWKIGPNGTAKLVVEVSPSQVVLSRVL